jgi:hypothetical protein
VNAEITVSQVVYDIFNKEHFTLKKLDKGVPDLTKICQRQGPKDMYKKDVIVPDYYDNLKIAATHEKLITKKRNSFVDINR